jgi:predicted NAD/FAD-binding protein
VKLVHEKMASPSNLLNVAIIGSGFAGLSLLIGLQKYAHIKS